MEVAVIAVLVMPLTQVRCQSCPQNCIQCHGGNNCTECIDDLAECSEHIDGKKCREENGSCLSCKEGFYGEQCVPCPNQCATKSCMIDGKCNACIEGYYGDRCDKTCPKNCNYGCLLDTGGCRFCTDGYFGNRCENKCSNCKNGTSCRQIDGRCNVACADGFFGDGCHKKCLTHCRTCLRYSGSKCSSCVHGKYSEQWNYFVLSYFLKCDLNCRETCLTKTCEEDSGRCTNGCESGYWGTECEHKCSESCKNRNCSTTDGLCLEGCDKGFYDKTCTRSCTHYDTHCSECDQYGKCVECEKGHYLSFSSNDQVRPNKCKPCPSECAHNDCNTTNGLCFRGCAKGHWGETCDKPCASNCLVCNQRNGECLDCINGSYGVSCSQTCSPNCATGCGMKTGECTTGCAKTDRHGRYCEKECGPECLNLECHWETGLCSSGCQSGFFGRTCNMSCSENCVNNLCSWFIGNCTLGCNDGFEGLQCTQVVAESVLSSLLIHVLVGIGGGILILFIFVVAVLSIRRCQRKTANNEVEMAERDRNANNDHLGEVSRNRRNDRDIEDSVAGAIYALEVHGRTRETTEHNASVALEVHGRTQGTTEDKASVALEVHGRTKEHEKDDDPNDAYVDIGNKDTFASVEEGEGEEMLLMVKKQAKGGPRERQNIKLVLP